MKKIENILKISNENFRFFARLILKITVPLVAFQALILIVFILMSDRYELFSSMHIVWGIAEGALVSLVMSVGGCLLMDSLERKRN